MPKHKLRVPDAFELIAKTVAGSPAVASPSLHSLEAAEASIPRHLSEQGVGDASTLHHLLDDLSPGFNGQKLSSNYYGFVTGGVLPIAEIADNVVTAWDQNVQVHLPNCSVSTTVEDAALRWLLELLRLDNCQTLTGELRSWPGRTFTTGATGANILGLACGREAVVARRLQSNGYVDRTKFGTSSLGLLKACSLAGIDELQILTTIAHSSTYKAASVVGLGRDSIQSVGQEECPWKFDVELLESALAKPNTASIVAISCGEVNTGRFATGSYEEMLVIRKLCDKYNAWIHVDGAFALFSRSLPETSEFELLRESCAGLELADSIAGDAHKCLNVPYDCGFFFTHDLANLTQVFSNGNAPYLAAGAMTVGVPSPLNIGLENSRRFRALPVYAVLLSHGRQGVADMLSKQVRLTRRIASFVHGHDGFELLPSMGHGGYDEAETGIIVLLRAKDEQLNDALVDKINESGEIWVSGTSWEGRKACRFAVSTWKVDVERDIKLVMSVLNAAIEQGR